MPFDFSLVTAPFRMQPGLRRIAAGHGAAHAVAGRTAGTCARSWRCSEPRRRRRCSPSPASTPRRRSAPSPREAAREHAGGLRVRRAADDSRRAAARLGAATPAGRSGDGDAAIGDAARRPARGAARRRPALPRLRGGLRGHRRRQRDDSLAGGLPAFALGAGGQDRPRISPRCTRRSPTTACWSRPAIARPPRHRRRALGALRLDDLAPTRACTSTRARGKVDWPDSRRCRSGRRARHACAPSTRPSSRSPGSGQAVFTIHVDSEPLDAALRLARRRRAGCTTRSPACRPACSPTAASTPVRDRLLAWLCAAASTRCRRQREDRRRSSRRGSSVDADGTPRSPEFGDVYHPRQGALAQARHVFLAGNALPARWRGRERFVVLETGFGLGNNFLATWAAWRADPERCRPAALPLDRGAAADARRPRVAEPRDAPLAPLAAELVAAWPPLTCNLHRLELRGGRGRSCCSPSATSATGCRSWSPSVDAFFLDGFAPARNPRDVGAAPVQGDGAARRARCDGRDLVARRATVRDGLAAAGFEVESAPGSGGKRDITRRPASRRGSRRGRRPRQRLAIDGRVRRDRTRRALPVAIVGAGLAGCAAGPRAGRRGRPRSLSRAPRGRRRRKARATPPALFHGVVHRPTTAAMPAFIAPPPSTRGAAVAEAIVEQRRARQRRRGCCACEPRLRPRRACRPCSTGWACPPDYVQALDPGARSRRLAGVDVAAPAWHFAGGGWVDPRGLARAWPAAPARGCRLRRGRAVAALRRRRRPLAAPRRRRRACSRRAEVVVLANAGAALDCSAAAPWPLAVASRGQTQRRRDRALAGGRGAAPAARRLGLPAAAARRHDLVRRELATKTTPIRRSAATTTAPTSSALPGCSAEPPSLDALGELSGRVGWRWASPDRLPLIGPVPRAAIGAELGVELAAAGSPRPDQPRFVAAGAGAVRVRALGSRGIAGVGARRAGARRGDHRGTDAAGGRPARCDRPGALR